MNHKPDIRKSNHCPPCPTNATSWEKVIYWLGIGLGSGLPKRAAGTWGTVGGLIFGLIFYLFFGLTAFLILTLFGLIFGSYICGKTSDLMNVHDDPHIVFDEWVGIWIALIPAYLLQDTVFGIYSIGSYIAIFVLFRIFDIFKPFPIAWADKRVSGGFGILLDDVLAGILAALVWYYAASFI